MKTILFFTRRFFPDIGGVESHVLAVSKCLVRDGHRVIIITESQMYSRPHPSPLLKGEGNKHTPEVLEKWQKEMLWQEGYISGKMAGQIKNIAISSYFDSKNNKITNSLTKRVKDKMFDKRGIFLSKPHPDPLLRGEGSKGIIIYRLPKVNPGWTKKFNIWIELWKNRELIRMSDVIHAHDVYFWYFPFRLIFFRKKSYITFHGYEGQFPVSRKAVLIRKLSEKLAQGNICVGRFIEKWYGTRGTYVTYGGVDFGGHSETTVEESKKDPSRSLRMTKYKDPLKIVFIGRLEMDTGLPIYLGGLRLLNEAKIPFEFEVCGDGSLRSEAEKYGKVHGFVENPEKYISGADIVFASSYLSILQALKYGKVVIAVYDNPLKEDYLKGTPFSQWIKVVGSEFELFNNIEQRDVMSLENAKKVRKWIESQTWEKVTELYYQLWKIN